MRAPFAALAALLILAACTPAHTADSGVPAPSTEVDSGHAEDSGSDAGVDAGEPPPPRFVLTQAQAAALFDGGSISLGPGTWVLPVDFTLDLGTRDLVLTGVPGKTVITSYDGTPTTDFSPVSVDTTLPDTHPDGLYVVTRHPTYSYGGGFAHLELPWNTNGAKVLYTQGTILKKLNGIWSRHFTGAGFKTQGNVRVSGMTFDNCQFYLFSPFGYAMSDTFIIENSRFNNVGRVISSCLYGGVDHAPDWFNALNYYPVDGSYRFATFSIVDSTFENIHTSIVWGFPPSRVTHVSGNTIRRSRAIAFFNLFMKNYADVYSFNNDATQSFEGNTFENIVQDNSWTTQLIRTSGRAVIDHNQFLNVSPQVALLYGGDSTVSNNVIRKTNTAIEDQSPVVVIKSTVAAGTAGPTHTLTHNQITAPNSFLMALEGASSCVIDHNESLTVKTVFSKNNDVQGVAQSVAVTGNVIHAPNMTNVSAHDTSVTFQSINISDNTLVGLSVLHTGVTPIAEYLFKNNALTACQFVEAVPQATHFESSGNMVVP